MKVKLTTKILKEMQKHKTIDWYLKNWSFGIVILWPIIIFREMNSPIRKYFNGDVELE